MNLSPPDALNVGTEAIVPQRLASIDEVYRAHVQAVWRSLRSLGVRDADIEDACQEVFVVAHRRRGDFTGACAVTTWLYGIALRVASDWRRRARRRPELLVGVVPDREDPSSPHARSDAARTLAKLLDALDDDKRAVFVLHALEQLPMSEVATIVEAPLQTAYARFYSAQRAVEAAVQRLTAQEVPK